LKIFPTSNCGGNIRSSMYGKEINYSLCDTNIPIAPKSRRRRRPHASTRYKPGKVDATLTADVIMVVTNGFWIPEFTKNEVP